jgi:hypothetical protein
VSSKFMRRLGAGAAALVLIAGGSMLTASSASANQVWFQSVGRASADAPCSESSGADLAAGWSAWSPSWGQWANNHTGGFVCNRSITWEYDAPSGPSGPGCLSAGGGLFINFAGQVVVPVGTPSAYLDSACSNYAGTTPVAYVYAPNSTVADELCAPGLAADAVGDENVWYCPNG